MIPARALSIGASRWFQLALGVLLGTAFLVLLWRSIDFAAVADLLRGAAVLPLLLALIAYAADFVLRAVRFWMLIDGAERKLPLAPTISPFVASFAISDILPFRLGDAYRVFWYQRHGGLPVGQVLGAMILERLLDLVAIVLLASLTLLMVEGARAGPALAGIRIVLAGAAVLGAATLMSPLLLDRLAVILTRLEAGFAARLAGVLRSISATIRAFGTLRQMSGMVVFSLGIWLLEAVVILGAWVSLGNEPTDILRPTFAFAVAMLGTLVPALPGHFGSYDYFGVLAFTAVGVEETMAAAAILLSHLLLWLPTALYGIGWLLASRREDARFVRIAP